ncbi:MAG TPA: hypothetical protein VE934_01535 [Polaromonas sp.]|uniref:hypothetical protein n=1 Tax=Polaromonas sp. TaxID=1869339 RepID=UPI002D5C03FA|nr:hypothetical protein [Polaromonas sp.]HYW55616.1 hypothetical protein [Polaromonas sp.]
MLLIAALSGCAEHQPTASAPERADAPVADTPLAGPDPGLLMLLVPDGQKLSSPHVTAWIDAASEGGVRLQAVTDRQFLTLGPEALKYAGLVLPDVLHPIASEALLTAIRNYTNAGGNTLLVHDFGIFALDGNQKPTYPIPRARLSDMAGVDYGLYDVLREKSTVVGPVSAMRSTMRALQVPPGKSIPHVAETAPEGAAPAPSAAASAPEPAAGTAAAPPLEAATAYIPQSTPPSSAPADERQPVASMPGDVLETFSGYLLGGLSYSSFVTRGAYSGKTLATSPQAGLVAGVNKVGRGQVLFVNLPLTYLKVVRTDGLPLHGFLHYFANNVLQLPQLSAVPNGVAGLTLDWHLDSFTAQQPTLTLEKLGIFDDGPFSIDMTAGPDAVTDGDGKGWNLDNNPIAQDILRRFAKKGHAIGSHGGWNHDYYGLSADESNRATFLPYLEKNVASIRNTVSHGLRPYLGFTSAVPPAIPTILLPVVEKIRNFINWAFGPPMRQYSPPVGNNPTWAMDWLEQQGVVAVYFGGHTGLGPTRQYREGQLRNPGLWVFPVTPAGRYATFEEFQTNKVPKEEVINWYRESVDFAVNHNTTRMIYMHPNGANVWPDVLQDLLAYAKAKGPEQFRWYTMTRLADFMTTRQAVAWTEQRDAAGVSRFEASHPHSLDEMVWLLPKSRYVGEPVSTQGHVKVSDRGTHWAVKAGNTRRVAFTATALGGAPL